MKHNKKIICFLFVLIVFDCFAMKEQNEQTSFFSYLSHPATLLCTGLASLGGYCLYNKESSAYAYEWLKQRFDETPNIIKCTGIGLGFISCYTYFYNKKHAVPAVPRKKIINMRKRLLIVENNQNIKERLAILEKHNTENEGIKKDLQEFLKGMTEQIEELKSRSFIKNEEKERDDASERIELITVPKKTLESLANKIGNLEIIVLGHQTNESSFGVTAPLQGNRLDGFERQLKEHKARLEAVQHSTMEIKLKLAPLLKTAQSVKRPVPLPPIETGDESGEKYI